jgi:hypothetical protein
MIKGPAFEMDDIIKDLFCYGVKIGHADYLYYNGHQSTPHNDKFDKFSPMITSYQWAVYDRQPADPISGVDNLLDALDLYISCCETRNERNALIRFKEYLVGGKLAGGLYGRIVSAKNLSSGWKTTPLQFKYYVMDVGKEHIYVYRDKNDFIKAIKLA